MENHDDPIETLRDVHHKLMVLSENSTVPREKQDALFEQAERIRHQVEELVAKELNQSSQAYVALMTSISDTTNAVTRAENTIRRVIDGIKTTAELAASVDDVISQTGQLVENLAKVL